MDCLPSRPGDRRRMAAGRAFLLSVPKTEIEAQNPYGRAKENHGGNSAGNDRRRSFILKSEQMPEEQLRVLAHRESRPCGNRCNHQEKEDEHGGLNEWYDLRLKAGGHELIPLMEDGGKQSDEARTSRVRPGHACIAMHTTVMDMLGQSTQGRSEYRDAATHRVRLSASMPNRARPCLTATIAPIKTDPLARSRTGCTVATPASWP